MARMVKPESNEIIAKTSEELFYGQLGQLSKHRETPITIQYPIYKFYDFLIKNI